VIEAFIHAGAANNVQVDLKWIRAEDVEEFGAASFLKDVAGLLIPGGFGERGVEGKIQAIEYARNNDLPFLGICLGLQAAVIEFARNVCGFTNAHSTEFKKTKNNVIDFIPSQRGLKQKGATMRLGASKVTLKKGTRAEQIYNSTVVYERHRHRYEMNNAFRKRLEQQGMVFSGIFEEGNLVEIIELPAHRFFVAGQFHCELRSRAMKPHPFFREFVKAAVQHHKGR
jgi:CTP synthase